MSKYQVGDLVLFPDPHSQVKHLSIVLEVNPDGSLRLHTFGTSHYNVLPEVVSGFAYDDHHSNVKEKKT